MPAGYNYLIDLYDFLNLHDLFDHRAEHDDLHHDAYVLVYDDIDPRGDDINDKHHDHGPGHFILNDDDIATIDAYLDHVNDDPGEHDYSAQFDDDEPPVPDDDRRVHFYDDLDFDLDIHDPA